MYTKPNGFGSSHRGGASNYNNRPFKKPFRSGGFNNSNRFGNNNRRKSKLIGQNVNIFIKKSEDNILVDTENITHKNFSEFAIVEPLKQNILNKGYTQPTPIQDQAIEPILQGQDLIGLASTGTGKTAAFLIPIINRIFQHRNHKALIVTPTRELAVQINEELRNLAWNMKIYSAQLIGGANIHRQIQDLRRNPQVVIGTPGRLKDLISRKQLYLSDFSIFILDEVDLMVDIGFIQDIKYFLSLLPMQRQSLFFSATISGKVREILDSFVKNPVTVSVKQQETSENVDQDIVKIISRDKKIDQLHDLLIKDGFDKVLIFGQTKHSVERLSNDLNTRGFKVGAIHGNKTQGHRRRILESFKRNEIQVLLATDVASRGLDIDNVTHVINYELPTTYEDYIHRIGRTGRANKKGVALTFVD